MKKTMTILFALLILNGCAASFVSKYNVTEEIDKFNNNEVTATMSGGVIDADYLGIVANAAEFNPFVIRSHDGKIITTGIKFTFEVVGGSGWLNVRKGSTIKFLINNGSETVIAKAVKGNIDYDVSAPMGTVYTTKYDSGLFYISPEQLRKIAYATTVEVRVSGASAYQDFPRQPNNHLIEDFLPNIKKFYETEVKPYL